MFALYSFNIAGLSWYLTSMGIVTFSVLGALPAPTQSILEVLVRFACFILCPCLAAVADMACAVFRPTIFSRDSMSTSIGCLPLGSFVLFLRFSRVLVIEAFLLLSLVGLS